MGELAIIDARPVIQPETPNKVEKLQVIDPIHVLDTARFEQMQRIAVAMASSSMIPKALSEDKDGDPLDYKVVVANCFLVVNQAVRWGMDPFGVAQCVSIVHGKLCYEGKLIAAVLDARLNIKLVPEYNDETGDKFGVTISGVDENGEILINQATQKPLTISGNVAEWRTIGKGSPWTEAKNHSRQLMYRGSREWARIYRPIIMLGVYAPDEMDDQASNARATIAHDVTPRRAPPPPPPRVETPADIKAIEHAPDIEMLPAQPVETPQPVPVETQAETTQRREPPRPPSRSTLEKEPPVKDRPAVPPADASLRIHFDPGAVRDRFANKAALATDHEQLAEAWDTIVEPFKDEFFPPDLDVVQKVYDRRKWELDG